MWGVSRGDAVPRAVRRGDAHGVNDGSGLSTHALTQHRDNLISCISVFSNSKCNLRK